MNSNFRALSRTPRGIGARVGIVLLVLSLSGTFAAITNSTHWSFQPLVRPAVPASKYAGAIDAFVSSELAKKNQTLAREAHRRALIRRLSFDLRGLPPTPEEVEAFLQDSRPQAYERLAETFLSSPQYGERWGRHWLDIVGYADSNGYFSADSDRPLAWKYRDYVVRSMNADKPLDRFIQEQIAGDELAGYVANGDVTPEMLDPLIATQFWRNAPDGSGESDGNPLEVKVDKYAVIEGQVQIFGSAFLGLTLQCSRCHDHKFEPVKQEEYYALQAILRPAFEIDHWLKPNERVIEVGTRAQREAHKKLTSEVERDLKTLNASLEGLTTPFRKQVIEEKLAPLENGLRKEIQKALETKEKDRNEAMKALLKTNAPLVEIGVEDLEKRFKALAAASEPIKNAIKKRETEKPAPLERISATYEPATTPPAHHLLVRGNHANEGIEVGPGVPAVFRTAYPLRCDCESDTASGESGSGPPKLASTGRRLALAQWVTSPENPIVARVLVNRIWHYHFGQGLVSTVDNLGQSGARPISPELLDYLATELIQSGWSLKHLNRLIVNSATWRQVLEESNGSGETGSLVRSEPTRLDAESLRDAILSVSGELDLSGGGPYVPTKMDKQGQVVIDEQQAGAKRRSIYLQQRRTAPVDIIGTFDGPAHNPVCVQRVSSTVVLQSLSLLNSEFIHVRARAFADRLLKKSGESSDARLVLNRAFELAYNRPPTGDELSAAEEFIRQQNGIYKDQKDATTRVWTDFCQMLLASNAFLYVD